MTEHLKVGARLPDMTAFGNAFNLGRFGTHLDGILSIVDSPAIHTVVGN